MKVSRVLMSAVLASLILGSVTLAVPGMLKEDPALVTGTLPNGVKYVIRDHKTPPGKMSILVHVRTGSLNETEEQRGMAHFTEHLAFNGSENFPPGKVIEYFESIGMQFGGDINAFTTYDQTCYMLDLPDCKEDTLEKGLLCMSDQAFRLLFLEEEIDKERGVILEEVLSHDDLGKRVRDMLFDSLFKGTRFADRDILGDEEQIKTWKQKDFLAYYKKWYRPDAITVIAVGDATPEKMLPLIKKYFGEKKAEGERPVPHLAGFMPFAEQKAFLLTDPELTSLDVEFINIAPMRPPVTTEGRFREDLVENVAGWIINRRIEEKIQKGEASFQDGNVGVFDFYNEAVLSMASVSGEPTQWKAMLDELASMVKQAVDHGFTDKELGQARAEIESSAKFAAERESTRQAGQLRMQYRAAINDGDTITSAAEDLKLIQKMLPTITLDEVNKSFRDYFTQKNFAIVLTGPESEDIKLPNSEEILAAGQKAFEVETKARVETDRPDTILETLPEPGKIVSEDVYEALGITTVKFENNVLLHHKFMDDQKDTVLVSITIPGGGMEETAANRGITDTASLILSQPATSKLSSTDIRDLLTGKNISVGGGGGSDAIQISVGGSPDDLESGLQVAYALLTDGTLEESALTNWKKEMVRTIEGWKTNPYIQAFKKIQSNVTSDNDPRLSFLTEEDVNKQTLQAAQAWYDRIVKTRPIEVAIVGEIDKKTALELAARYLGSLNARPENAKELDPLRVLKREKKPKDIYEEITMMQPFGIVISGFIGCNESDVQDRIALNLAKMTLDSRMVKDIREERGWVYSLSVANQASSSYRNAGMFGVYAPTNPEYIKDLEKRVTEMYDEFAKKGQTPEELEKAKKQIFNELDKNLKKPGYWVGQLNDLHYHSKSLDDIANKQKQYEAKTAEDVLKAFTKYYKPENTFQVAIAPKASPKESDKPSEEAKDEKKAE